MSSLYFLTRAHHRTASRILSSPLVYTSLSRSFSSIPSTQKPLFDKILIANRGEIACRIIRTCKKMGIKTVAVYSEPDAEALHVRTADEAICVGPAQSAQSYLNIPNILAAVKQTGAQAVHPGYGFLSENRHFQEALQAAGVKFLGPGTKAITAMGTKISSKKIATEAKVNVIPGYLGKVPDENEAVRIAREIGYPVMIKASSGGGGKGMRVAYNDQEVRDGFRLSSAEAKSSFGDDTMFVEKFIEEPRHIEIQVLADSHGNAVYLNERECTVQRRNQKVIEEAPSIFLDPATRKAMGEQAVRLAKTVGYESAGTVEFLVDKHRNFYYLEMNTRLQVEHPVTEYITGVDLVEQMIRVGAGLPLPFTQEQIPINGWAFETRVYAEDPLRGFLPSIGRLSRYEEPEKGPNVRIDTGVVEGAEISIYYDPMIAKLITYGKDRDEALQRMRVALDAYVIRGVTHNVNFLRSLCDHPRFIKGALTTAFIPEEYPKGYHGATLTGEEKKALVAAALAVHSQGTENKLTINGKVKSFDSQRFHSELLSDNVVLLGNDTFEVNVDKIVHNNESSSYHLTLADKSSITVTTAYKRGDIVFIAKINGKEYTLQVVKSSDGVAKYTIQYAGTAFDLTIRTPREHHLTSYMPVQEVIDTSKMVLSPMPGAVYSINVAIGDMVAPGQEVCVVEAMKMQNALRAVNGGKVKAIHVKKGQTVQPDQLLVEFE